MGEEGNEELLFNEFRFGMIRVLETVLMVVQQCEYIKATELHT